jgi:hypothetical protein
MVRDVGLQTEQAGDFADHGFGRADELGDLAWRYALFELEEDCLFCRVLLAIIFRRYYIRVGGIEY